MNKLEKEMVYLLNDPRVNHPVSGIKVEFEAEGTRHEEAMRLKDVVSQAGLGLNTKIGVCEGIKDMLDSISLGAERIIAPMIETPYAFIKAVRFERMWLENRQNFYGAIAHADNDRIFLLESRYNESIVAIS